MATRGVHGVPGLYDVVVMTLMCRYQPRLGSSPAQYGRREAKAEAEAEAATGLAAGDRKRADLAATQPHTGVPSHPVLGKRH